MKQKPLTFTLGLVALLMILGVTFYFGPKKSKSVATAPSVTHSDSNSTSAPTTLSSAQTANAPTPPTGVQSAPPVSGPATAVVANAPRSVAPGCFTVTYHHKPTLNHGDEEACSHHKNILKVEASSKINPASVCIRVNGRPVKYENVKGHTDQFMIGSIAGPQSQISIRYCMNQATCNTAKNDCTIPRDEFMDAIGGGEEEAANATAPKAKWDPKDKEGDMSAEVDEVQRNLANMENSDSSSGVFKDWLIDSSTPACGAKAAETASAK